MQLAYWLKRIPKTVMLLDAAVAALSATLLPARLIPENLEVIGDIACLFVIVGFLMTVAYQAVLSKWLRPLAWCSLAALLVLVTLQLTLVCPVSPYGGGGGVHRFLVGYQQTAVGREAFQALGAVTCADVIKGAGHDRIATYWGKSYLIAAVSYTLAYMAFILGVVLALGGTDLAATGRREPGAHHEKLRNA